MSLMGVMDNMINAESSSKLKALVSGNDSEGNQGVTVLQNGNCNIDPMKGLKFKRRKVCAVRNFPPGCGPNAIQQHRSRGMEVETCENGSVSDNDKVGSTANKEDDLGQRDEEQPCNETNVELTVDVISMPEDENLQENGVEPLDSVGGQNILRKKELSGKKFDVVRDFPAKTGSKCSNSEQTVKVDVVRDFSANTGSKCSNSEQTVKVDATKGKNLVLENLGSDVSNSETENLVRDMVVYEGGKSLGRDTLDQTEMLNTEMSNATVPKPIYVEGRKKAKKRVPCHSALKLTKKRDREYGEGSRMKNTEINLYSDGEVSPDIKNSPGQETGRQSRLFDVTIPPSRPSGSSNGDSIRNKVKETLRLFHGACRKLLQEEEAKPKEKRKKGFRVDFEASKILKIKGKYLNTGKLIMGTVPGIEVGDEFQYRMELNILGIHRPSQGGIDSMKDGEDILATSIVASGGYDDDLDNSDILIYTGQGGNVMPSKKKKGAEVKEPKDQKLVQGNLALANSINKKNPVRVIRGKKNAALQTLTGDARGANYVYDGLYLVEAYWQELGSHGKNVFKFQLRRMPGQPELAWKVVKISTKSKYREGLCKLDISEGKERLPISAVNEIDDEKPPLFIYTVKMIYPDWLRPAPPKSCSCTRRCTEARNCACVRKNGGEIPYNYDGAIVGAKTIIYECGPHCRCPSSCYLRVTQHGIKFQLEIFKTQSRGWGVRSLNSIPSGSFICEYVGELLEDSEAERRTGNDEYLFDIGNSYDTSLADGMSKLMPGTQASTAIEKDDDETSGFTIDAAAKGNIGRFINHSCSPNLYAQNVLYDHEDKRIPHVMFFAMDNIPPLQELSYHYNYMLDQVRDSNGNIKKKLCYCGSAECTGRLY